MKRYGGISRLVTALALSAGLVTGAAAEELVIGGALSLTGVQAPLDEAGLKGAEVAVKVLNEQGGLLGKQVKLVNIDGKSDPVTVGSSSREQRSLTP